MRERERKHKHIHLTVFFMENLFKIFSFASYNKKIIKISKPVEEKQKKKRVNPSIHQGSGISQNGKLIFNFFFL
jgi:hypothetical protein